MVSEPSQEDASSLLDYFRPFLEQSQASLSHTSEWPQASATLIYEDTIQEQKAQITPPPELRLRAAVPEPQNQDDCQQASQSASQAIQQANQQASDSIRQASQQASQSADAASRSASEGIRQAQQSASQSISAASRSASSALSSASSVVASIQSSASDAISRANGAQSSAEASASTAQGQASSAVLQASAAVAAATGKAAAAGSSFLAAAAKATESAQASVSAFGSAASAQIAQANSQVSASQTTAITATQTAVAIVGSIIASVLLTIFIFFLIMRHKKKKALQSSRAADTSSLPPEDSAYPADPKPSIPEQLSSTIAASQEPYTTTRTLDPGRSYSTTSFSLFPKTTPPSNSTPSSKRTSTVKTTSVSWNPANPPKPPTLGSWLKTQDISPFGPIKLPTDSSPPGPLGGQLKSPLRSKPSVPDVPNRQSSLLAQNIKFPKLSYRTPAATESNYPPPGPARQESLKRKPVSPDQGLVQDATIRVVNRDTNTQQPQPRAQAQSPDFRESKASIWTATLRSPDSPSTYLPSFPDQSGPSDPRDPAPSDQPASPQINTMQLPTPQAPVRNTAEWLLEQQYQSQPQPQSQPQNQPQSQSQNQSQNQPQTQSQSQNPPRTLSTTSLEPRNYDNPQLQRSSTATFGRPSLVLTSGLPRNPRLGTGLLSRPAGGPGFARERDGGREREGNGYSREGLLRPVNGNPREMGMGMGGSGRSSTTGVGRAL